MKKKPFPRSMCRTPRGRHKRKVKKAKAPIGKANRAKGNHRGRRNRHSCRGWR